MASAKPAGPGDVSSRLASAGDRGTVRAQSEVVGVLLFTGVIVVTVGLVATFVLSANQPTEEPTVDLEATADASTLTLSHGGGDGLRALDVTVILAGGADAEHGLDTFTVQQGDGDGRFEAGEVRTHSHGASDVLRVRVVHEPSNALLYRNALDVD